MTCSFPGQKQTNKKQVVTATRPVSVVGLTVGIITAIRRRRSQSPWTVQSCSCQSKSIVSCFPQVNRRALFSPSQSSCPVFPKSIVVPSFPQVNRRAFFSPSQSSCRFPQVNRRVLFSPITLRDPFPSSQSP